MLALSSNMGAVAAAMRQTIDWIEAGIQRKIQNTVHAVHFSLHAKTPVWTGQAIRNYVWGKNQDPAGGELPEIEQPAYPGNTNMMPLGTEPRRPANAAASTATLHALAFNRPWGKYIVINRAHDIGLLERGMAPEAARSRSPNGMFGVTVQEVIAKLNAGVL